MNKLRVFTPKRCNSLNISLRRIIISGNGLKLYLRMGGLWLFESRTRKEKESLKKS